MKTPLEICIGCQENRAFSWEGMDEEDWEEICDTQGYAWRCPATIKDDDSIVPYPPPKCPWRLELLMLIDKGNPTPKNCF